MLVDTGRVADLDSVMDTMVDRGRCIPLLGGMDRLPGPGRRLGRSVLTRGDHARLEDLPAAAAEARAGPGFRPPDPGPASRLAPPGPAQPG